MHPLKNLSLHHVFQILLSLKTFLYCYLRTANATYYHQTCFQLSSHGSYKKENLSDYLIAHLLKWFKDLSERASLSCEELNFVVVSLVANICCGLIFIELFDTFFFSKKKLELY